MDDVVAHSRFIGWCGANPEGWGVDKFSSLLAEGEYESAQDT